MEEIREHVLDVLSDMLGDGIDKLCEDYGIDCIDWNYPFEGDSNYHFEEMCNAIAQGIQETISWEEYINKDA